MATKAKRTSRARGSAALKAASTASRVVKKSDSASRTLKKASASKKAGTRSARVVRGADVSAAKAHPPKSATRLKASTDPPGYWLAGEFREGFPDDPELTRGQRLRIAGWARKLTPGQFTEEQRRLLEGFEPPPTPAREQAEALADFRQGPYWRALGAEQRALVDNPSTHPGLAGASYPLRVSELATLVGATRDRIHHWGEIGLLPARRSPGGQRQFYAASAAQAFFLAGLDPAKLSVLRQIGEGSAGNLLVGISAVLREQASADSEDQSRALLLRAAADLQDVGLSRI
jgi:hypothetical protein